MVVSIGGGLVFNSPIIKSQSFCEPVLLNCELHKSFSDIPCPLVGHYGYSGLKVIITFPPHGREK